MPVVNPLSRELVFKVVYYGPGLGGKTTTLQAIHKRTPAGRRGELVSVATPVDRTLFFDFLPIEVEKIGDMTVRLQLFTVPGQVHYNATRKLVLTGADGIVLVADSQRARCDANEESLQNLVDNLREHGKQLAAMPHVLCYNKRDLNGILTVEELERRLNPFEAPSFASVATRGEGVFEALNAMTRAVLRDFRRRAPERASQLQQFEPPEPGIAQALDSDRDQSTVQQRTSLEPAFAARGPGGGRASIATSSSQFSAHRVRPRRTAPPLPAWGERGVAQAHAMKREAAARDTPTHEPEPSQDSVARRLTTNLPPIPKQPTPIEPELLSRSTVPPQTAFDAPQTGPSSVPDQGIPTVVPKAKAGERQFSLSDIWSGADSDTAIVVEQAILDVAPVLAVVHCGRLVQRALRNTRQAVDGRDAAPDVALSIVLLGLDVGQYIRFRALVRRAAEGEELTQQDAVQAYAFAIAVRVAQRERGIFDQG